MAKQSNVVKTEETSTEPTFNYADLLNEHKTVSGVIRYLASKGQTKGQIAKITGKRYQHVRNVLITPVKNPTA